MGKKINGIIILWLLACSAASCPVSAQTISEANAKAPDYSKEPFVFDSIRSNLAFENDGTYTVDVSARVRIQAQSALQAFGVLNFSYAGATSTMEIRYVRVIKPGDKVVQTPPENFLDMPADITRQAPFYSDLKEEQVAVKGLEIGDTLEYSYHAQITKPLDPGQFWFSYNFLRSGIVLQEELQISVPDARYVNVKSSSVQPTIEKKTAYRLYTWKTANLEDKNSGPQDETKHPSIQVTTFQSWNEVGQWFHSLAAPQAVPTLEVQAKAKELTAGAKSDSEKAAAIYKFVSTRFRYIGISLGIGRYQPHPAAEVLSNDYGDCKDKHTLVVALFAAAGLRAYPALISSGNDIDPDVPSPGQFDHVITALPHGKDFVFLDTTAEVAPFGYLVPSLRDKKALVIPDDSPARFVQTPADPPFKPVTTFHADATLDDTGTLTSKMLMSLRGDDEIVYRTVFRQAAEPQWKDVMQRISSNLGFGGTVSDVTLTSPDATDAPFHIEYSYKRKEYSDWSNKQITPPLPPIFLPAIPNDTDKNSKPIKLGSPSQLSYEAIVKLPAGADPHLPPAIDLHEKFADYKATYSFSNGVLHAERTLAIKSREVAAGNIEAYRKFQKAISDDEDTFTQLYGGASASSQVSANPEAQSFYEQGREAWQQRNMPAALDDFQQSVNKDPKFGLGWFSLGSAHMTMGDVDQGIEEMKKGIVLDPGKPYTYKYLAATLQYLHREQDALETWRELEKADPQDSDAPHNIAAILIEQKEYSEAATELESALKRKPDNAGLLLQLGETYSHTADKEKAVATLKRAAEIDPSALTLNDAAYFLADSSLDMDDALRYGESAVKETEEATNKISLDKLSLQDLERMSQLGAYWDTLGWVHFRLGDYDLAEKYLNAAWLLTFDPLTADHLGQVYDKRGKKHEAAVAYSQALSAGKAPKETQERLDAIRPQGKYMRGEGSNPVALQDLRTIKLGRLTAKHASAEFFVLFGSGSKVVDSKFISGSNELRDAGKALAVAKYKVSFPDAGPAQIVRRGVLDCEPELTGCMFVLIPPHSVHAVN